MHKRQQQEQQLVTVGHAIAAFLEACEVKAAFGVISIHNMPILDAMGERGKIRFVMARDDYAYLQTDTDRYFSTVSLAQLEKRLDGHGFFRVHRGYLVNLSMVEEIEPVAGGTLLLTLNGVDEKIPVSRRRVSALKKALGL